MKDIYKEFDKKFIEPIRYDVDEAYCPICRHDHFADDTDEEAIKSFLKEKIKEAKLEAINECIGEEKEIMYGEIDTGIGIDRLEYDGQDRNHGYNQKREELKELKKKYENRKMETKK